MSAVPVMAIHNPRQMSERLVINESDYDPGKHHPWDPDKLTALRSDQIRDAILAFDPEDEKLWTKSGSPQVKAIETAIGFDIQASERDEVWDAILKERAGYGDSPPADDETA